MLLTGLTLLKRASKTLRRRRYFIAALFSVHAGPHRARFSAKPVCAWYGLQSIIFKLSPEQAGNQRGKTDGPMQHIAFTYGQPTHFETKGATPYTFMQK